MKHSRRSFLRNAGLATAGAFVAPYILPSGRLFAQTGSRIANHVVFVLFAGGIRHQESVDQGYLASQNIPQTGNLMENMLTGAPPSAPSQIYTRWQPILSNSLASQGTLFRELHYSTGPTGHFNGHTAAITGNYTTAGLNLNVNPEHPTIFEYYRKHNSPSMTAKNCWWMSEGLGPYPSLNFSRDADYGPQFGANYLRGFSTFGSAGPTTIANGADFQPDDVQRIRDIKQFLDSNFDLSASSLPGIVNTEADKDLIEQFIKETMVSTANGSLPLPLPAGVNAGELNGDLINVMFAWQVLEKIKPELMVINTFASDACHSSFTDYVVNLHKADYGVGWLWDRIQATPGLADDTIMICMPDHGRNMDANNIFDNNGLRAYDHTSDDNSRRVFALVVGPPSKVLQGQVLGSSGTPVGETVDIVPTIAHILGFYNSIPSNKIEGTPLYQAFV